MPPKKRIRGERDTPSTPPPQSQPAQLTSAPTQALDSSPSDATMPMTPQQLETPPTAPNTPAPMTPQQPVPFPTGFHEQDQAPMTPEVRGPPTSPPPPPRKKRRRGGYKLKRTKKRRLPQRTRRKSKKTRT